MDGSLSEKIIGTVVSDDESPSFDTFKFEAFTEEYVSPGALVGTSIADNKFLVGRVSGGLEIHPNGSASEAEANTYRRYEVDVMEEGLVTGEGERQKITMIEPSDMAAAGAEVFVPGLAVMAEAMGFATDRSHAFALGKTRITAEDAVALVGGATDNVLLHPEILQRHVFICGTTGTGKSYATGVLIEEIVDQGIPVVILDSQREYTNLARELGGTVLEPGADYTIHLSSLTDREMSDLVPTLKGTPMEDLLSLTFLRLKRDEGSEWRLNDLLRGMAKDGPTLQLPSSTSGPAISRVRHHVGRHTFLGEPINWKRLLQHHAVVNIDCAQLDQGQLQLIVAATLRDLTTHRLDGRIPPYVVVLEEAHLLVPETEDSPCKQVIRENVRTGRHYGICVILITQSPVDIDKKTIRQCNTRLIFALEADQLDALRGVRADATEDMLRRLPKMPVGTCVLSGTHETIKHAIPVRVRTSRHAASAGVSLDLLAEIKEKWSDHRAARRARDGSEHASAAHTIASDK